MVKPSLDPVPALWLYLFINRPISHLPLSWAPHPGRCNLRIPFPAKNSQSRVQPAPVGPPANSSSLGQMLPATCDNHAVAAVNDHRQSAQRLYFLTLWRMVAGNQARSRDSTQGLLLTSPRAGGPTALSVSSSLERCHFFSVSLRCLHTPAYESTHTTGVRA